MAFYSQDKSQIISRPPTAHENPEWAKV